MLECKSIYVILCIMLIFICSVLLFGVGFVWGKYKVYEEILESDIDGINDYLTEKLLRMKMEDK